MEKKLIGWIAIIIVVGNFLLFIFTVISSTVFLIILALSYFLVKYGLPKLP